MQDMNLDLWLRLKKGRLIEMADHFGVSAGAVSQWRNDVPYKRMKEIEKFTGGQVSFAVMIEEKMNREKCLQDA